MANSEDNKYAFELVIYKSTSLFINRLSTVFQIHLHFESHLEKRMSFSPSTNLSFIYSYNFFLSCNSS